MDFDTAAVLNIAVAQDTAAASGFGTAAADLDIAIVVAARDTVANAGGLDIVAAASGSVVPIEKAAGRCL